MAINKDGVWIPDPDKVIQQESQESDLLCDAEEDEAEGDQVLIKKRKYIKYDRLIEQAEAEGRINGKFKCLICGMRYSHRIDAVNCCKSL